MTKVLMVCTGNICRSTMAHQVFEEIVAEAGLSAHIIVDSAGVSDEERGRPIDRRAAQVLRANGHGVPKHRARQVLASELDQWDLILAMTHGHLRALERLRDRADLGGLTRPEIRLFREFDPMAHSGDVDLPDPWYGGSADFVSTLEVIERTCPTLLDYVKGLS